MWKIVGGHHNDAINYSKLNLKAQTYNQIKQKQNQCLKFLNRTKIKLSINHHIYIVWGQRT